jgi:Ca-activated chloride channel family protein
LVAGREGAASVILVTDGLETCGGDPCAAVREARQAGGDLRLHVAAFDVAGEDVSQLECAAQAGGGLFLAAQNAGDLATALEAAAAPPAEIPAGRLVVRSVADGKLHDTLVRVTTVAGERVVEGRTYAAAETNPRSLPLSNGRYRVTAEALGIEGDVRRDFEIEIVDGATVERELDFSSGELAIGVTRNGALSDAVYRVLVASTGEAAAQGRSYAKVSSNPALLRLTAGRYAVEVQSVEIEGGPVEELGELTIEPRRRVERAHDFASGGLAVGAERRGELVDAVVHVLTTSGVRVAQARTYARPQSNPTRFVLPPGEYRIEVQEIRGAKKTISLTVSAGRTAEHVVELE